MSATDPNKYPIELSFPDISQYRRGNTGVDFYTSFDSGIDGPHVLVNALVHVNEVCGVIALENLFAAAIRPPFADSRSRGLFRWPAGSSMKT